MVQKIDVKRFTARSELRKVLFFWRRQSVVFCLCMKCLGNRWTDLRQIHTEDVFGPSLGQVWRSRSKANNTRDQMAFSALSAACVQRRCFQCGSVPLRSDVKGMELPPANILIPLERQLIALQLCRWEFLYNETLQQTFHPLLSKLSKRRQI